MSRIKMSKGVMVSALVLIVANLFYAFYQHYHCILDGDLGGVTLPSSNYQRVLSDPFGLRALLYHERNNVPNRFVVLYSTYAHFRTWPFFFQKFTDPISSVYLTSALAKTVWQLMYTYLIGVYVSGQFRIFNKYFILSALLLTPLFQNCGYVWDMGIIDPPISYAFAYAFSTLLIGIFFLPFYLVTYHKMQVRFGVVLSGLLMVLSWAIAFNGPISAPVMILVCGFMWLEQTRQRMQQHTGLPLIPRIITAIKSIPKPVIWIPAFAVAMSFYSFYIGKFNIEGFIQQISMAERYQRLPGSIFKLFTTEGMGMLMIMIILNLLFLLPKRDNETGKMIRLFIWIAIYGCIYMLLLPLGGYRFYRPEIVRHDVMVPVIVPLIAFYVLSTYHLLQNTPQSRYKLYLFLVLIPLCRYFIADKLYNQFDNSCERQAMEFLAKSKEKTVLLPMDCSVMEWGKITDPAKSRNNTELMRAWGIIHEEKYYYQK
ncbi:MAG: hypothetical protein JNM41_04990 [Flavipsychrobacter sp.]|nr:hypothetical protein [Flavipsychrobacter sp.]